MSEVVNNKQIVLKDHIDAGFPKMSDFITRVSNINLNVAKGSNGVVVKNLYLSCDPYMRMRKYMYTHVHTYMHCHLRYISSCLSY